MAKAPLTDPAPKKVTPEKVETLPDVVWFESRNPEPLPFHVAGIRPIRNYATGRLEWEVRTDDVDRFMQNHFVLANRVVRKQG